MKKILYIEDEPEQIMVVQQRLEANGYEVISAPEGEEGCRKAHGEKPDLILLDLFLPGVNGFDICKRLKNDHATKDIPILMITASGVEYIEDQVRNAGADGYIKKPYESETLVSKVDEFLKE
ncbi:PleD family two-component system response regulator [Candidatus Omnitrophota bacterium]